GLDYGLDVSVRLDPTKPKLLRRPQAQEFVAASGGAESQLLVVGEFLLKPLFALVEARHPPSPIPAAAGRDSHRRTPNQLPAQLIPNLGRARCIVQCITLH